MLMPGLSVTLIGVAIAATGIALNRPVWPALRLGLIGAWVAFVAGALIGLVLEVLLTQGALVVPLGHIGAAAGAAVGVVRAPAAQPTP